MRAALLVTSPKFNKPVKGSPEEMWAYSSKVNNFIEVCKQHNIPWCLVDYAHGIMLPETKIGNYNNKEIDTTMSKWQEGIVKQAKDNKIKSLVFVGIDNELSEVMNTVAVSDLEALVTTFKSSNEKLSDKKYPFVPEGVELKKHKRVAATFCAGSKVDVTEGNPKQLWSSASGRINAFINHCERVGIPYVILSYKYGIVHQDEVIDNYDIGKSELDMDEWGRLVDARAQELGIEEIVAYGMLARNSPEISETLENRELTLVWADNPEEITDFFSKNTSLDEYMKKAKVKKEEEVSKKEDMKLAKKIKKKRTKCFKCDYHGGSSQCVVCGNIKDDHSLHQVDLYKGSNETVTHERLIKDIKTYDPMDVGDKLLVDDHRITHAWWQIILDGKSFKYTKQEVRDLHDIIIEEMRRRGMQHNSPLRDLVSREQFIEDMDFVKVLTAEEITDMFEHVSVIQDKELMQILGGEIYGRNDRNQEEVKGRYGETYSGEAEETRVEEDSRGSQKGGDNQNPNQKDNQEGESPKIKETTEDEAKASQAEDKLKPPHFFHPLKGIVGYRRGERYTIESVQSFFKETDFPLVVQKKYDGARHVIWKVGNDVRILSDGGEDVTDRLPTVVKELQVFPHTICLDAEIEGWKNKEHEGREAVSSYIRDKDTLVDDKGILVNVFDCLYFDDASYKKHDLNPEIGDLHNQLYDLRLKYLDIMPFSQSTIEEPTRNVRLNISPSDIVNDKKELEKSLVRFAKARGSEGAMIKIASSVYPLNGMTSKWVKYKTTAEAHCVVLKRIETRTQGVYNYEVGLSFTAQDNVFEQDIRDDKFLFVGKTFNTKTKAEPGDIVTIAFHTLFLYTDRETDKIRLRLYEPRWLELRADQNEPGNIRDVIDIAENAGLLQEKELTIMRLKAEVLYDQDIMRIKGMKKWFDKNKESVVSMPMSDLYMDTPREDKPWKYVIQMEWRGKSVHQDFRTEQPDWLIGWTLNVQPADVVQKAPETLKEAEELSEKLKLKDWSRSDKILVEKKDAKIPKEWLTVEGPKDDSIFVVFDEGTVEYGAQEPQFHEYFLKGKRYSGRVVFRLIPNPRREPDDNREFLWISWKPEDQTPYVLTKRSIDKKYDTGFDISGLPRDIRRKIPQKYQYWKVRDKEERIEIRKELIELIKKEEIKFLKLFKIAKGKHLRMADVEVSADKFILERATSLDDGIYKCMSVDWLEGQDSPIVFEVENGKVTLQTAKFVLQHHRWRSPTYVRAKALVEHWDLRFDFGPQTKTLLHFVCDKNPAVSERVAALKKKDSDKTWITKGKPKLFLKPGSPGNPTKFTPAWIEILDVGKATFHIMEEDLMKVEFQNKIMKGIWIFRKDNGVWLIEQEEIPQSVRMAMSEGETLERVSLAGAILKYEETNDGMVVHGGAITHGTWNGIYFPPDVVEESYDLFPGVKLTLEHNSSKAVGKYVSSNFKNQMIWLTSLVTDDNTINLIKDGKVTGYSIDAWISVDKSRRIVLRIVEYNDVSLVKTPACSICLLT